VTESATDRLAASLQNAIRIEAQIDERAAQVLAATPKDDELRPLLEEIRTRTRDHRTALEAQLARRRGGEARGAPSSLVSLYGALNEAALSYGRLHAIAHRAFDSQGEGNTADLAEAHLRAHAAEIQQLNLGVSDVVVRELERSGRCVVEHVGWARRFRDGEEPRQPYEKGERHRARVVSLRDARRDHGSTGLE